MRFQPLAIALGLLFAFLMTPPVMAQQQNAGGIKGDVKDPSGAAIAGATITVTAEKTGVVTTTTSNESGAYVLFNLPIGYYQMKVNHSGFKSETYDKVRLDAGETLTYDVSLAVGAL
ncbi:MAG: carboxypeptidase-like regulatory domain-containing protein, partial [Candidatus Acidiferrales bacterium]